MDWIWIIVALLVGLAVGGGVAYAVVTRRYGDRESVAQLRGEYDRYRGKVTEHFVETADLVNTLTRSYKRVYDHLEEGAYELVGEETLRRQLDAPHEEPVMIEYLGQRRVERHVAAPEPTSSGLPTPAAPQPTEDASDPTAPIAPGSSTSARVEPATAVAEPGIAPVEAGKARQDVDAPSHGSRRARVAGEDGASPPATSEGDVEDAPGAPDAEERTRSAG